MTQAETVLSQVGYSNLTEVLFNVAKQQGGVYGGGRLYFDDGSIIKLQWQNGAWIAIPLALLLYSKGSPSI